MHSKTRRSEGVEGDGAAAAVAAAAKAAAAAAAALLQSYTGIALVAAEAAAAGDYILLRHSLMLIGESRLGTIVNGGFKVKGKRGLHVSLETMTITGSARSGIHCDSGVLHVKNVSVDGCGTCGVYVQRALCTLINCRMTNCKKGAGIKSEACGIVHIHGATEVTGCKIGIDRERGRFVLHAPMTTESAHDNGKNWNPNLPSYKYGWLNK